VTSLQPYFDVIDLAQDTFRESVQTARTHTIAAAMLVRASSAVNVSVGSQTGCP